MMRLLPVSLLLLLLSTRSTVTTAFVPPSAVVVGADQTSPVALQSTRRDAMETTWAAAASASNIMMPTISETTIVAPGIKKKSPLVATIEEEFPGAIPNPQFVERVTRTLRWYGFERPSTLLATSLCCDEINRALENDFARAYGNGNFYFRLGGLAGFAFAGVTGFGAMAHHIPDNGACVIVYGPHVGVDKNGVVGTVPRWGRKSGGACCGSAKAASDYVMHNSPSAPLPKPDTLDHQQQQVVKNLMNYSERIRSADNPMVDVSYCLYEAQNKIMEHILEKGLSHLKSGVQLALVGGIQINTPKEEPDYFLPMRFDIHDNKGTNPKDLFWEFDPHHLIWG